MVVPERSTTEPAGNVSGKRLDAAERQRRNRAKKRARAAMEAVEAQKEAERIAKMPAVLRDMKHVYMNPEGKEETNGQKNARALLEKDPKGFMSQMTAMERDHREREEALSAATAETVAAKASEWSEVDDSRAVEVCEEWLRGQQT